MRVCGRTTCFTRWRTRRRELWEGGAVELRFQHRELSAHADPIPEKYREFEHGATTRGCVTRCDPPRLLSFTWGEANGEESEVTFELLPVGAEVWLTLTHRRIPDREALSVIAGWHTHLDILGERLAGEAAGPFWSRYSVVEEAYAARGGAAGVTSGGSSDGRGIAVAAFVSNLA